MITPKLLSTVFQFASFGCEKAPRGKMSSSVDRQVLGTAAMCCVNELLSKNCVPPDFEEYLLQLFQQTFYLLRKLTGQDAMAALDSE